MMIGELPIKIKVIGRCPAANKNAAIKFETVKTMVEGLAFFFPNIL